MASLIPGYNYDIFISYRQKDNKHDGWVTEFVNNLKGELESTFKEEISVYFDINPHDGLLETHDVDESLKEKLKCLVFIPIVSRTYCDPKSFAWEHEFKAFVDLASQDQFGLKVKLPNGNVSSRVLPIRIHDLDAADLKECESVLGGVLRGIEFIYKEAGIDKPLAPDDDEKKNINNTKYRIQIIKVAHSIKEIILGMKSEPARVNIEEGQPKESAKDVREEERRIDLEKPVKVEKGKILIPGAIVALLIVAGIIAYPKIFKSSTLERLRASGERISIAVMPFQNMTNDTTWNVWQVGIQEIITSSLSTSEELSIRQTETIKNLLRSNSLNNYASLTPSIAGRISQKLDADLFINGKIIQSGKTIRVYAQLVESKSKEVFKPFQTEGTQENILAILDSLALKVKDFLIISKLKDEAHLRTSASTSSPEAYRCYIYGGNAGEEGNYEGATGWYLKALEIDTNFTEAALSLPYMYSFRGLFVDAKKWCLRVYKKRDLMPERLRLTADLNYAYYFGTPYEEIEYDKQRLKLDNQSPSFHSSLAFDYIRLYQYDKVIPEYEKSLELYKKLDIKPSSYSLTGLGYAYHKTGQYKKEKRLYKKAERDFPDDPSVLYNQVVLSLTKGKKAEAEQYIEKFKSASRENSASVAIIATSLGSIYREAGILDKAEEYYRQALSLEPESPVRLNGLAWFLIDNDRDINEGMQLIDKALELSPNNSSMLDTKGWGLYKQGRFKDALEFIQKADSLKPIYNHELYLHLEAAKKAVEGNE